MAATSTYDALVIGAGPAGSSAAWTLARAGLRIAIADRKSFPRDKVCGDALIPDALGAIDRMGLRDTIDAAAHRLDALRVYAPNGRFISVPGTYACLPRYTFDRMLLDAAAGAGADLLERHDARAPLLDDGGVAAGRFQSAAGERQIRARITLLATGANATALSAFGLATPLRPNAVAGRAYFEVPPALAARFDHLAVVYDRSLCPGYGWIFPGPGRRFNVGVGYFGGEEGTRPQLHDLWRRFLSAFEPAATIARESVPLTPFRGAPLRTGLSGAQFGRPGLLALGEAAGMTYPFTGEGIGKAMESGLVAAGLVAAAPPVANPDSLHAVYEAEIRRRFASRYAAYKTAESWVSRPWLLNFLAWRAESGRFARRELAALLAERGDPRRLFSSKGLFASIFR